MIFVTGISTLRCTVPWAASRRPCFVNLAVIVRKQGPRDLTVEGAFGEDYMRVRELLYTQFYTI